MKKKLLCILLCVTLMFGITGCNARGSKQISETTNGLLIQVPGYNDLYYVPKTGIVYILFNEYYGYEGYGYMSPYYSRNGKLCRYVDGQIKEV